jgi:catechol 2,3-dioxygenase-like lactoylglutathione lyase family enzyme
MGNGVDGIAFFWFPDAPEGVPGESLHPTWDADMRLVGDGGGGMTATGSTNHIAFDVAPEKIEEYLVKLRAKGVAVTEITNHSNVRQGGHKPDYDPATDDGDVFIRSLYFKDPNGTLLEFACWTTTFDESTSPTSRRPPQTSRRGAFPSTPDRSAADPLGEVDRDGVARLLAQRLAELGGERQLVGAVAERHERATERLAVDGAGDLHQASRAEEVSGPVGDDVGPPTARGALLEDRREGAVERVDHRTALRTREQ